VCFVCFCTCDSFSWPPPRCSPFSVSPFILLLFLSLLDRVWSKCRYSPTKTPFLCTGTSMHKRSLVHWRVSAWLYSAYTLHLPDQIALALCLALLLCLYSYSPSHTHTYHRPALITISIYHIYPNCATPHYGQQTSSTPYSQQWQ
jgi:hypothetical protein